MARRSTRPRPAGYLYAAAIVLALTTINRSELPLADLLTWLAIFVLFPFFNKDNLRAGDLVAGTWVVEAERRGLPEAMTVGEEPAGAYAFGEAELSIYGEHELQVLEDVLRRGTPEAQRQVLEAICRKIGWHAGEGDDRAFLEAFYTALRARLERDMRFGKRKKSKFDG